MFICNQCGECCRNLDKSEIYTELHRGDGVCIYLLGSKCTIYEQRPLLCNIDESYHVYFKDTYSLEEYYKLNYESCNKLRSNKGG